jgi:hypothetical protein
MSKNGLIRLPDKVAAALLQALAGIDAVRNDRLVSAMSHRRLKGCPLVAKFKSGDVAKQLGPSLGLV